MRSLGCPASGIDEASFTNMPHQAGEKPIISRATTTRQHPKTRKTQNPNDMNDEPPRYTLKQLILHLSVSSKRRLCNGTTTRTHHDGCKLGHSHENAILAHSEAQTGPFPPSPPCQTTKGSAKRSTMDHFDSPCFWFISERRVRVSGQAGG